MWRLDNTVQYSFGDKTIRYGVDKTMQYLSFREQYTAIQYACGVDNTVQYSFGDKTRQYGLDKQDRDVGFDLEKLRLVLSHQPVGPFNFGFCRRSRGLGMALAFSAALAVAHPSQSNGSL